MFKALRLWLTVFLIDVLRVDPRKLSAHNCAQSLSGLHCCCWKRKENGFFDTAVDPYTAPPAKTLTRYALQEHAVFCCDCGQPGGWKPEFELGEGLDARNCAQSDSGFHCCCWSGWGTGSFTIERAAFMKRQKRFIHCCACGELFKGAPSWGS